MIPMKPPASLFKYQPANCYTLSNLKSNSLWFSNPHDFNDPFDCDMFPDFESPSEAQLERLFSSMRDKEIDKDSFDKRYADSHGIPNRSFEGNVVSEAMRRFNGAKANILFHTGVACLSAVDYSWERDSFDAVLLWSHYAQGHAGLCLEFDTNYHPFSKAQPICYVKELPKLSTLDVLLEMEQTLNRLIRIKSKAWQYEREWRIPWSQGKTLVEYDPRALKTVYFGLRADHAFIGQVKAILPRCNFLQMDRPKDAYRFSRARPV